MRKLALLIFGLFTVTLSYTQDKTKNNSKPKEVLLIGTFHYGNPGADIAKIKSFDILSKTSQHELNEISSRIKIYNPTKIFVEWPYDEQKELDSLYQLYKNNTFYKNDSLSDFYRKNEIFQLAFRVAKENNLDTVYAIDYKTSFPFGDVMNDIEKNNQTLLNERIQNEITKITTDFDQKINSGLSLKDLTYFMNSPELRKTVNNFHNNLMLLAGGKTDFNGPLLTAEWFKRNLYMWSLAQKSVAETDEKIMILAGASHVAMFELFINQNSDWNIKELEDLMNN